MSNFLNDFVRRCIYGIGKSTISKAIEKTIKGEDSVRLKPFNTGDDIIPSIEGIEQINSVKTYNEEYVFQYLFLPNAKLLDRLAKSD